MVSDRERHGTKHGPQHRRQVRDAPGDGSEGDLVEQSRLWRPEQGDGEPPSVPPDASEGDVVEQARPWAQEEVPDQLHVAPDVNEPDALDQSRHAHLDEERRGR